MYIVVITKKNTTQRSKKTLIMGESTIANIMDMDEFLKPIFPFNNFENKIRVI
jgi:hypothetical protein